MGKHGTELNAPAARGLGTWDQAIAYVQELNTFQYLGYDNWRLPTRNELQSLVDYSRYNPATTFPYTESNYWSSTNYSIISGAVKWSVTFVDGLQMASWTATGLVTIFTFVLCGAVCVGLIRLNVLLTVTVLRRKGAETTFVCAN